VRFTQIDPFLDEIQQSSDSTSGKAIVVLRHLYEAAKPILEGFLSQLQRIINLHFEIKKSSSPWRRVRSPSVSGKSRSSSISLQRN
jgi:hypothetical protein